jgi:hypothetical protein
MRVTAAIPTCRQTPNRPQLAASARKVRAYRKDQDASTIV